MVGFRVLQNVLPKYGGSREKSVKLIENSTYKWSKLTSEEDAACNLSWCMHEDGPWSVLMKIILYICIMWAEVLIQKLKLNEYNLNTFRFQWMFRLWTEVQVMTALVSLVIKIVRRIRTFNSSKEVQTSYIATCDKINIFCPQYLFSNFLVPPGLLLHLNFLIFFIGSNYTEDSWKFFNSAHKLLSYITYQKCNSTWH